MASGVIPSVVRARGWRRKKKRAQREEKRERERTQRERNHRSDVENTRASRVPTWKRHRQLGSRGPFRGCVLSTEGRREEEEERKRRRKGETTGSQSFGRGGENVCRRGPKPPQSATTKTPRSLFHERPATPLDPQSHRTRTSAPHTRARFHPLSRPEKKRRRGRLILARPAAKVPPEK